MNQAPARAVFVVPPELATGFRLAGVTVRTARTADEASTTVTGLLPTERGVIAVYEPFYDDFAPLLRSRLGRSVTPVVVAIPSGLAAEGSSVRRHRILGMLQRAVGYHVTFGEGES